MKKNVIDAVRDVLIFAIAVFLLVLFWQHNILATGVIVGLFLLRACFWWKKGDVAVYLVGAVLGPLTEIIATRLGIWTYACPSFLNIPLWLPFAWGFAAVIFVRIAHSLLSSRTTGP